jgi:lysophospholipase L1-like esterase
MRFLALGDSYTIGESVAEAERWPVQLAQRLGRAGIDIKELTIVARTGWTTFELQDGINAEKLSGVYDLVSLLIGVNNQYRGLSQVDYYWEFKELLERAIQFAGGDPASVLVLSIPDWSVTPFAEDWDVEKVSSEIRAFNQINQTEASSYGANYVNVTPISLLAATDSSLIADDGLHPSGRMYARWAEKAYPIVRSMLGIH